MKTENGTISTQPQQAISATEVSNQVSQETDIVSQVDEVAVIATKYDSLSNVQKQRADYLRKMIGDHAVELVSLIDGRGRNSWPVVYEKVMKINQASMADQQYHTAIYDNFKVGVMYTSAEIISIIAEIRQDLKLVPYLTNTKNNCENDVFSLFLAKEKYDDPIAEGDPKRARKLLGFTPTLAIRPE